MLKKIFTTIFLALFPVYLLAAAHAPEKLIVMLDSLPNADHAPLIIAKAQHYFKEQNLDVELISATDPNHSPQQVLAGKADIALIYQPQFMKLIDHGAPLIRIGTLIDKPLSCVVALKESDIKSIADLKGKKIGVKNGEFTTVMLKVLLAKQGLNDNDVSLIPLNTNPSHALSSRQVDAVAGLMRNLDVPQLEKDGKNVVVFFPEEHGVPTYSELIFITNKQLTTDRRLPRFLTAVKKAVDYLDEHPKEGWQQFAKAYPQFSTATNHQAWFATLPYFAEDPGNLDHEEWQEFASFMQKNQLIKSTQPVSHYAILIKNVMIG